MKTRRRTIFEWLTTDFHVSIRNDENFALKRDFRVNYAKILVLISAIFIVFMVINFYIFNLTNTYFSQKKETEYKEKLLHINLMIDTLHIEIARRDTFIKEIQKVITQPH